MLKVKKLNEAAKVPFYATAQSAGFDLSSSEDVTVDPGARKIVGTGLAFDIPDGFEIQIRPRSGLAAKHGITVLNAPGTIDADYVDEVKIILLNTGKVPFTIAVGDRIAQGVLAAVARTAIEEVDEIDKSKDRGGGFGSTGVK